MSYAIMAINPGHNGAVALLVDGKITYYCEEERLTGVKYDGNPFKAMIQVLINNKVDELIIGGTTIGLPSLPWTSENPYTALVRKFNPNVRTTLMGHLHHLGHAAAAFYNSGFDSAAAVIVDGAGSFVEEQLHSGGPTTGGYETESIYHCSYPHEFNAMYKRYSSGSNTPYFNNGVQEFDSSVTVTKAYEAVSDYLGFGFIEAGKTMGLSPYGHDDNNIPDFFIDGKGNRNLLIPLYPAGARIDEHRIEYLHRSQDPKTWHYDFSKVRDIDKNIAFKIQQAAEIHMFSLIEKAIDITGESNVVISGGFGLNCVANYKYVRRFKGINFHTDPIAHDGGTTIGLAQYAWYHRAENSYDKTEKITSVYLSTPPDYGQVQTAKDSIPQMSVEGATPAYIAQQLADGKVVAIFQGAAEGGPRALGNRSILFDPRREDGQDIVNSIKNREWFRPFAGSVMVEHANDWFDMAGLIDSPFMMYAVDVKLDKVALIPAITHVDNTCRVQTVSRDNNTAYYDVIEEFFKITNVPVVLNTSFNLAGNPLVETPFDAIVTLFNSNIDMVYMPDIGKVVAKYHTDA